MTREQTTQQDVQQDGGAAAPQTADPTFGLRPDLYAQIMQMIPGDSTQLAEMIENYPEFMGKIMMVAAPHLGNAAVQRALALVKQMKSVSGAAGTLGHDEARTSMGDGPPPRPLSGHEMMAALHDPSDAPAAAEAAPATPKAAPAAAPAWVAGARAYNDAHLELVDEFNDLTSDICRLDGAGKVDPQAVARWQSNHGLAPDGKIGPQTVAAARKLKAKAPEVAATAPQADARPPV
ncbi:MAG TPA: peptidoglycan-binding domain-containing protein [Kofleriaceae bacterium]|jgi:hypothetical protein|nr:peptidoglycan-binding domain-containing protein [Kofleriaceae bacterium]